MPLINGFENSIASSDQFVIVDAGSLSGAFTNVAPGTRIAVAEAGGHIRVNYGAASPFSPNQVVLSHFATGNLGRNLGRRRFELDHRDELGHR